MTFTQKIIFRGTSFSRLLAYAALITLLAAVACENGETDATATPTLTPDQILAEAESTTESLTSVAFRGEFSLQAVDSIDGNGTPIIQEGELNETGTIVGQWEEPDNWTITLEGFGQGSGINNIDLMASNGDRVLLRQSPDDDWSEIASAPIDIPAPSEWNFIFDLDLEQRDSEPVANEEQTHAFSTVRSRDADSLPPIFDDLPPINVDTVTEAFDLFVSEEDFQVRQLFVAIQTGTFIQTTTWYFESHNEDISIDLPEELTAP